MRATPLSVNDEPALQAMLRSPQPVFVDPSKAGAQVQRLFSMTGTVSVVAMPIAYGEEFFGLITASVRHDQQRLERDEHLLERLHGMASHAATALLNARLLEQISHQATHDTLTGLPNRLVLKDSTEQARGNTTTTALLYVDLDWFKAVNDSLGHEAGDELLVQVAARLESLVRGSDVVARLGGDEFAVLLVDVPDDTTLAAIRDRIAAEIERPYDISGKAVLISSSIGTSILRADDDYESLLRRSDSEMYRAKRARHAVATAGLNPPRASLH
jgi:diguanylate cyclase (GGDEF)-like protein